MILECKGKNVIFVSTPQISDIMQEVGNVPYAVENGYGKFTTSPKEIAEIVGEWFGPKVHELKTMIGLDLNLNYQTSVTNIEY